MIRMSITDSVWSIRVRHRFIINASIKASITLRDSLIEKLKEFN